MNILVAIFNAVKELAKSMAASRKEIAEVNSRAAQILRNQAELRVMVGNVQCLAEKIWGAMLIDDTATQIIIPWTLDGSTETTIGENVQLTDTQKGTLGPVKILDAKDQPALIQGGLTWRSSDETVATVVPTEDGLSASVVAGIPGSCVITATGDADLGEGVKPIVGTRDVTVTAGAAVKFEIPEGAPEEQ